MAKEDFTAPETKVCRVDVCCSTNIMIKLWNSASDTLTEEELEWFSGATENAELVIISLRQTLETLGCVISNDANHRDGSKSVNFLSNDNVTDLMFMITNHLDTIQGLIYIGSSADYLLRKRRTS